MIIKIVKIYIGLSLVLLWVLWGQLIFGQFLGPAYISQDLQAPSYVVGTNDRVLIYCLSLPSVIASSVCWSLQCLISTLTQRGRWWTIFFFFFQAYLFSCAVGREGRCKQITLACARNASATLGLPQLTARVASLPALLRLQVAPPGTIRGRPCGACTSQV